MLLAFWFFLSRQCVLMAGRNNCLAIKKVSTHPRKIIKGAEETLTIGTNLAGRIFVIRWIMVILSAIEVLGLSRTYMR